MRKCTRPILRYFGGKFRLAPKLIALMPPHDNYVEPFCGAASVLLRKPRVGGYEVLNDRDTNVVGYLHHIQGYGKELAKDIRQTKMTRHRWEQSLKSNLPLDMAIRSFHSIGSDGLWKNSGYRGHPTALAAWKTLPGAILAASERLSCVTIREIDALNVIRSNDSQETFFYVDPPYLKETLSSSHGYAVEFTELDHRHLAGLLHGIVGKAMVSGYRCGLYDKLYADWRRVDLLALKDNAKPAIESVWLNY